MPPLKGKSLFHSVLEQSRVSDASFDILKQLVRSRFGTEVGFGITPSEVSEALAASIENVNAALSDCEQEGDTWVLFEDDESGESRWSGDSVPCNAALPPAYAATATAQPKLAPAAARTAPVTVPPPLKKPKLVGNFTAPAAPVAAAPAAAAVESTGDAFEDLKILLHAHVAASGQSGVTSGKLGYNLNADRKTITAALYACQTEGYVQNNAADGMPRWVSLVDAAPNAISMPIPAKYAYKGTKVGGPVAQATPVAPAMVPKLAPVVASAVGKQSAVAVTASIDNPVAFLNEWCQKNKRSLQFADMGSGGSGFLCKVALDGQEVTVQSARNKKEAKSIAAAAALQALGLA